jgi:uncharacterized protein (DUF983 family)
MLWRGATRRCARCGSGGLFHRWFTMVERCPRCGYRFEREEGFFLGAYVINLAIGLGMCIAGIVVGFALIRPVPSAGAIATGTAIAAGVAPIVAYPFTKTVWTAIDMIMRSGMGESYAGDGEQPFRRRG